MTQLHFLSTILVLLIVNQTNTIAMETDMPNLLKHCYEQFTRGLPVTDIQDHSIQSYCLGSYIWQSPNLRHQLNLTETQVNYIRSFYREYQQRLQNKRRHKRHAQRAFRRELRVLDDAQRKRFFDALIKLKNEKDKFYDKWADIHEMVLSSAHFGPAFLGFHRVYLLFLEFQLQRIDGSVSLCYWDSTMDHDMVNPLETAMFSRALVGNGIGPVINGPFAGWKSSDGNILDRNIHTGGALMIKPAIRRFLTDPTVTRHEQVSTGFRELFENTIEGQHGNVHVWVGGDMRNARATANDPVFILHHTFIDYIWERFRQKIRQQGVDPSADYPWPMSTAPSELHDPSRNMTIYRNYTNLDGYSDVFTTEFYHYDDMPSCASNCSNSKFLRCKGGVCVALSANDIGEQTSAQVIITTRFLDGTVFPDEEEEVVSFQPSFVDPRTLKGNGITGPTGENHTAGIAIFQSFIKDHTMGNRIKRNGTDISKEAPVGFLQGMRSFKRVFFPGSFSLHFPLTNFGNPSHPRILGTVGRNFKTRNMLRSGILTRNVGPNAIALPLETLKWLAIAEKSRDLLRQRLYPSLYSPLIHLWGPSVYHINTQRGRIRRPFPNRLLRLNNVRKFVRLHNFPIRNTFTLDGVSDINRRVFMPVRIVYLRRPGNFIKLRIRNFHKNLRVPPNFLEQSDRFSYRGNYTKQIVLDVRKPRSEVIRETKKISFF
ncbi:tyrosinase-like protein 1 [Saccostrea cucullata]|uniref:tyrosinase-like protein 1 n=1 Tax=Saccostrea cuccullata TaxID=36930 RepID=UPI002ED4FA3B